MGDSLAQQYKECCAEQSARVLAPILSELERVDRNEVHALHEVKLAGNTPEMFGERAGAVEAAAVASLLCKRKDVELLDLSYNKVDDEGAESLSVMLRENSSLKELNLCGNQIGPGGCAALCAALSSEGGGGGGGGLRGGAGGGMDVGRLPVGIVLLAVNATSCFPKTRALS